MESFVKKSRRALLFFGILSVSILLLCSFGHYFSGDNNAYAEEAVSKDASETETNGKKAPANTNDSTTKVGAFASAALVVGLSVIGAGMAVSNVGAAALGAVAERPEIMGKSMIFVGLAEGLAIYGLIIAIMILGKI